jgi:glycosyltransferase involved in cell wall biosynthesis
MTRPRLSICIPTYKREDLLRETLNHLREVCDDDVEIAISDNCSPDGTQAVINSFAGQFRHFRAIRQTQNRGAVTNFSAAMSLARGEYLYPLSDDDQIHFQALQNAISIMQESPNIVAVYGGYEDWIRSTGESFVSSQVTQRTDFARGNKLALFNKFTLLWHPVCRTEIFQRYCSFAKRNFGVWELAGSLLERGDISVIPEPFYKHSHTEPRLEYELTEGWYHDAWRAEFECFVGRMGPSNPVELARFVSDRVTPAYLQGLRFAKIKRDFLAARNFILRARAYGLISEQDVMSWERDTLVGMVAERLLARVELMPDIDEIVFVASTRLQALRQQFAAIAPKYSIVDNFGEKSLPQTVGPHQCLVTYDHAPPELEVLMQCEPALLIAVEDLIETCRVTDQSLAFDVVGVAASAAPILLPQNTGVASSSVADTSESGRRPAPAPAGQVRRNDPCPCGSTKKYKHCHGRYSHAAP